MWDKQKFITQVLFDADIPKGIIPNMASFNPYNIATESTCSFLITGRNCYKYYKLFDNYTLQQKINVSKRDAQMSQNNYTCHLFVDGHLILCTDRGEILFCDAQGEYKTRVLESPGPGFCIQNVVAVRETDFIIANPQGRMLFFTSTGELKNPFKLENDNLPEEVDREDNKYVDFILQCGSDFFPTFPMMHMDMVGDWLVYTTRKKQLMKMKMNREKHDEMGRISFVINPFHKTRITALATCMKQPLLVTASDSTLFMWHYNGPAATLALVNA